ncbi:hypothetical protein [Microbulbifer spongiae]|uniref:Uncharacterized protein n=1 Tax=Microbulbifer spongiae TaxID=2944933 RepID=A0ABY9EGS6_9GAMM|nr:hypothetical protein [Microbulbifer sp. MI-G]WKD50834.1 hypothetical protein M8T91_05255 [Microbulbifer sp. MI-G]
MNFPIRATQRALGLLILFIANSQSYANPHPAYLTNDYCNSVVEQFIDSGMRSLDKYINEHFNLEYTGGIRNTIRFLEQRLEWLTECNDYLMDTSNTHVFHNQEDTQNIFTAINALARELQHVRSGVEYRDDAGNNNPAPFIKRRYRDLAQLLDRHHTRMLMQRQFQ